MDEVMKEMNRNTIEAICGLPNGTLKKKGFRRRKRGFFSGIAHGIRDIGRGIRHGVGKVVGGVGSFLFGSPVSVSGGGAAPNPMCKKYL